MEHTPEAKTRAIAAEIARRLDSENISIRAAAAHVGIPPTTFTRRLTNASSFKVWELAAIAELLGVEVGILAGAADNLAEEPAA